MSPPRPETDDSAEAEPLERTNPCGEREYRFPNGPCQDNSKNREEARKQALFAGPACTRKGAVFTLSSAGSRGPGRQLRDRPCAPPPGSEPKGSPRCLPAGSAPF